MSSYKKDDAAESSGVGSFFQDKTVSLFIIIIIMNYFQHKKSNKTFIITILKTRTRFNVVSF